MTGTEHYRKLERMYRSAPCNVYYAPSISVADRECRVDVAIRDDFFHVGHAAHGSLYFKALDDAAFFAANSIETRFLLLTASFHITFLRPIASGVLHARGFVVKATRTMIFADAVATDSEGEEIGRGSGIFAVSRIELGPEVGYE